MFVFGFYVVLSCVGVVQRSPTKCRNRLRTHRCEAVKVLPYKDCRATADDDDE
jgi:hypothetical protein